MFKEEIKGQLKYLNDIIENYDRLFTEQKIVLHNLEKMGYNIEEIKNLEDLGIELYKNKTKNKDFIKKMLEF